MATKENISKERYYLSALNGLIASGNYQDHNMLVAEALEIAEKAFDYFKTNKKGFIENLVSSLKK